MQIRQLFIILKQPVPILVKVHSNLTKLTNHLLSFLSKNKQIFNKTRQKHTLSTSIDDTLPWSTV